MVWRNDCLELVIGIVAASAVGTCGSPSAMFDYTATPTTLTLVMSITGSTIVNTFTLE